MHQGKKVGGTLQNSHVPGKKESHFASRKNAMVRATVNSRQHQRPNRQPRQKSFKQSSSVEESIGVPCELDHALQAG
jgi:hypothetical protein